MSGSRRRAGRAVVGALAVVVVAVTMLTTAGAAPALAGPPASRDVSRVLVISLPATSWSDIRVGDAPHLQQLFADAAIGDMVTRTAGRRSSIAGGYTSLGAGGRASAATPLAGQAFEPSEPYGASTAGDVFRQRTGISATGGLVHVGIDAVIDENKSGLFDPKIGGLGDALAKAGRPSAVIANGDGAQAIIDDPLPQYQRSAVNALDDPCGDRVRR